MIELDNLSKTYAKKATRKGAKATRPAVDSLSLEIRSGEIFGFLGPNGAGKTTTIKMLTGVLKPDSGKVKIDGIELARRPLEAKARFGYVGDNPELWNRLKAAEFLNFMGVKENAGIFCHNNAWIHLALCQLGEGDRALEYYRSICPSAKQAEIERYRSEPYVYAQMIAGRDAPCYGEAKNSWLTGTAAWTFVALAEGILGVKPEYEGLTIDPCISSAWKGFKVSRKFRGATYDIEVRNPRGVCKGVTSARVDGKQVALAGKAAFLPIFPAGTKHRVEIELG